MNVIGSRPDGWWRDRTAAMRSLAQRLAELDEDVLLVLDGRERDLGVEGVKVRFAPHADDLIAELARPGDVVVTSDRELAGRVRARGAAVEGVTSLNRRLGR
jgi:uncharacterized protein YaiI (UPF0178 family)